MCKVYTIKIFFTLISLCIVYQSTTTRKVLDVLGSLYQYGANPVLKSKEGKTAKEIAVENEIPIAAALLGMYNNTL